MRDTTPPRRSARRAALALLAVSAACAGPTAPFTWVESLPRDATPADGAEYRLAPGDVIAIAVWNQDAISVPRTRVREDGRVSMAFLQDVEAVGLTPGELAVRMQTRLKAFIVNPVVTVRVEETRSIRVSVVGEVRQPGQFDLGPSPGVLQALAAAGGITDYAKRDGIYVLRSASAQTRIRFRYEALVRGDASAATFRLRDRDVVVVE
jgi:polysaccharide export outer membrane protein